MAAESPHRVCRPGRHLIEISEPVTGPLYSIVLKTSREGTAVFRKRPTEWIVVADGAQARILKNKGAGKGLAPLESMKAADGRSQPRDLGTDRPGRLMNAPAGNRHAVEPHDDPRDQTERAFAKDLIQRLERGAQKSEYDRFVLVAPPKFMGHLRAALSGRTKEKLSAELTKELIHLSDHELAEYLRGTIRC